MLQLNLVYCDIHSSLSLFQHHTFNVCQTSSDLLSWGKGIHFSHWKNKSSEARHPNHSYTTVIPWSLGNGHKMIKVVISNVYTATQSIFALLYVCISYLRPYLSLLFVFANHLFQAICENLKFWFLNFLQVILAKLKCVSNVYKHLKYYCIYPLVVQNRTVLENKFKK